ncbi:MAG: hypothetical protein ACLT16_19005 [[Clostridium] innocuum]
MHIASEILKEGYEYTILEKLSNADGIASNEQEARDVLVAG